MKELIKLIKLRLAELRKRGGEYEQSEYQYSWMSNSGRILEIEYILSLISSLGFENVGDNNG